jgi:intracellular multiplication protein IcmD
MFILRGGIMSKERVLVDTLKKYRKEITKAACFIGASLFFALFVTDAFAAAKSVGDIASTVRGNIDGIAKLITAGAFVAGLGFAVGAILKFKQHKDNPTQIPVGTPIALTFIAAALIFIPNIFGSLGQTVFGTEKKTGGTGGEYSSLLK